MENDNLFQVFQDTFKHGGGDPNAGGKMDYGHMPLNGYMGQIPVTAPPTVLGEFAQPPQQPQVGGHWPPIPAQSIPYFFQFTHTQQSCQKISPRKTAIKEFWLHSCKKMRVVKQDSENNFNAILYYVVNQVFYKLQKMLVSHILSSKNCLLSVFLEIFL